MLPTRPTPPPTPQRSDVLSDAALQLAKLKGLLRSLDGGEQLADGLRETDAPGKAGGILASGGRPDEGGPLGVVLLDHDDTPGAPEVVRALGPALIWADRHDLDRLLLLSPPDVAGDLARRAAHFDSGTGSGPESGPRVEVHAVDGTTLVPAAPAPIAEVPALGDDVWALAEVMRRVEARPVDDHGRLVAEIDGLEVARVTIDDDEAASLEIGVGQADRELQQLVHGHASADEVLERAAGMVRAHRRAGVPLHPLNRLARERWLRSMILDAPAVLGLASAEPVPPLRPRSTLLGTVPSAAVATTPDGADVVVVASVGIDVDVVPEAADYRARTAPDADLLLVMPPADIHPALGRQVGRLARARFVAVTPPWVEGDSTETS